MFKAAGIDAPPTTWDEFEADAEKLTDPPDQYGYEMFASESAYYWYPWLYQAGGDLLTEDGKDVAFNSAEGKKAAEFYVNLAKYAPPDYLNSNSYDGRVAFANGQVGMYMAGAWFAGDAPTSSRRSTASGRPRRCPRARRAARPRSPVTR